MSLMSYDNVISSLIKKKRTPHLLLGNGFSIAYDPNIFSYNALHTFIHRIDDPLLTKLFDIVNTKNFELVMQQLNNFCELIEAFSTDKKLLEDVRKASSSLKCSLVDAIKELHPEHVFEISDDECAHCAEVLSPYLDHKGNIFSTNYDVLLYWVLMRSKLSNGDGFGRDREDDPDDHETELELSDELYWGRNASTQTVHYLHGALPIFDTGIEVIKEHYDGDYLLENIEKRLERGEYPIFVASGNGEEKLNHIMHNRYLSYCYETLAGIEGSLVTFGFNFGEYDHHIIEAINTASKRKKDKEFKDKLWSVYIGVYSDEDRKHIEKIAHKFKPKVTLYDAKTVSIWR